ncbi:MAG: efflux transporter outer membrane subunit [Castellaniella sp.]
MPDVRLSCRLLSLLASVLLAGCAVGPDYQRPAQDVGVAYAHAPAGQWRPAEPGIVRLKSAWWQGFNDPQLDELMTRLSAQNLDLVQAEAQYRQAQAALASSRAGLFPTLDASASRSRAGQGISSANNPATNYSLSATASWELDLWGRVRRGIEASRAGAQASQADLAAMRLSLQSTLAQTYFSVRTSQQQDALLGQTYDEYQRALEMTRNRYAAGVASSADVAAAQAQLEQVRVQRIRLSWQREQSIHALAVLVGQVPAHFNLPAGTMPAQAPEVPVGVPSVLLQHRPDIAAAERRVREANARIGVAQAAWFPDITLSAQGGYRAGEFASWLLAPARFWTIGPALALSLFDGGARSAAVDSAQAGYDAQAAAYRKTVLDAMREVEDALVQSASLVREQAAQNRALAASRETLRQVTTQYKAGLVDYLSVVQAQASALSAEQNTLDLQAQRLTAAVLLMAALGGGYTQPSQDAAKAGQTPASAE